MEWRQGRPRHLEPRRSQHLPAPLDLVCFPLRFDLIEYFLEPYLWQPLAIRFYLGRLLTAAYSSSSS
jgi:hypothetical protein